MLELDYFLYPFALHRYPSLPARLQAEYEDLLGADDADLFEWLKAPATTHIRYQEIIQEIKSFMNARGGWLEEDSLIPS